MSMTRTSVGIPMSLAFNTMHSHTGQTHTFTYRSDTYYSDKQFNDPASNFLIGSPGLESQQVLRHEIEAIAAVEGEPCPQRVAALCPEARKIEQSHDVVRLQRRPVKSPSVRRPGCPRRPRCPCRPSLAHRCSWCTVPQFVLASQRCRQCCRCQKRTGADRCRS
jgi:hypothetical protein